MVKAAKKKVAAPKRVAPAKKAVVALSGADIEKQLALAHKIIAGAGYQVNYMLTVRRLNLKRIEEAAEKTRDAADHMQRLVALLRGEK